MVDFLQQIHGLQERLYHIRWDSSIALEDKQRDVSNLFRELWRVEKALAQVRSDAASAFEKSLALEGLGLKQAPSLGQAASGGGAQVASDEVSKTYLEQQVTGVVKAREEIETADLDNLKMMRVKSSEQVKDKSPAEKWQHLYHMYGEWKDQTEAAKGQHVATRKAMGSTLSEDEIIKLRGAIYALKQRTNMSQADKALLADLQARLKAAQQH